ncbi:MAG: diacylglycerol/lipid kinase family protein [Flavobacteriales bacterium]
MSKTLFLMNGSKKIRPALREFLDNCSNKLGDDFQFISSQKEKELIELTKVNAANFQMIVAIGGDGTINEIVNGLMQLDLDTFPILALIPYGTGNDLYQSTFFQTFHYPLFFQALEKPNVIHVDIGKLVTEKETRFFLNVADIGFGGAVVLSLNKFRQKFGPSFSYGLAILKTFVGFKRPIVRIVAQDFNYSGQLLLAAACNGSIFGNGLHIHPGAQLNDGVLNMTILAKVSLLDYVRNVLKVKRGKRITHAEAHYFESSFLQLSAESGILHAETDGEYILGKSFEITLIPQRLKILSY